MYTCLSILKTASRRALPQLHQLGSRLASTAESAAPSSSKCCTIHLHYAAKPSWFSKQPPSSVRSQCQDLQWAAFSHARRCHHSCLQRISDAESRIVTVAGSLSFATHGQWLLAVGFPLVASQWLAPVVAHCHSRTKSDAAKPKYRMALPSFTTQGPWWRQWCLGLLEEGFIALRGAYLMLLFSPAFLLAPFALGLGIGRLQWMELVRWSLEQAGPAFIKWGQWAATRPDLFAKDLTAALEALHTSAPSHSFQFSRHAVEAAFKQPISVMFDWFEEQPVASGSIAQIHRATLSKQGAHNSEFTSGTLVAVKVRHPGVTSLMSRDFTLMQRVAKASTRVPGLASLHLDESIRQFGAPLKEQLDLSHEAENLTRFNFNFRRWRSVSFPRPARRALDLHLQGDLAYFQDLKDWRDLVWPLVASDVLVETFEEGQLISNYVNHPGNVRSAALANLGLNAYLKMLLRDNFLHADLHPGNILVRVVDPNSLWGRITYFLNMPTAPRLVLLDAGMTAELTRQDQMNLVKFFRGITTKDGGGLADTILNFSDNQTCPDPRAFRQDMSDMFGKLDLDTISEYTSEIINEMMDSIRKHQVSLKGVVSAVVVTTLVLEGWSTKLDPDIRIMDALKDTLPVSWSERSRRIADKLWRNMSLDPVIHG